MLENLFKDPAAVERLRRDPLGPYLDSLAASLVDLGYAASSVRGCIWRLADFGRWLARGGVGIDNLDDRVIEAFVNERRRQGRLHRSHRPAVGHLLDRSYRA